MNKNIKYFLGTAVAVLTLASCANKAKLPPLDEETYAAIESLIEIKDKDAIYGNIYLPETLEGAEITWKSNRPDVISVKQEGDMAPGVVNRQGDDVEVKLTARAVKDGCEANFEQTVTVKAAPEELTDDDYTRYLFGHFTGEGTEGSGANKVAVQEQIYFALSKEGEGLKFQDLNNRKPVLKSAIGEKGVRDPYMMRSPEGDRFFIIATDLSIGVRGGWATNAQGYTTASISGSHNLVLWESNDLVNWKDPILLPVAPEGAGMAWAPEMIYHEESGQYVIFWASCIYDADLKKKTKGDAIYYTTTRDFLHFGETQLFVDNMGDGETGDFVRNIIDTTVLKIGDYYYSASKDGDNNDKNGGIRIMRSDDLFDYEAWEKVCDIDELGLSSSVALNNQQLEGPELFMFNKCDWADPDTPEFGLMADQYMNGRGYLPMKTTDIEDATNANNSWSLLTSSQYNFDTNKKRHGTLLRITDEEAERLLENFPIGR